MLKLVRTRLLAPQLEKANLVTDKLLAEMPQLDTARLAAQLEKANLVIRRILDAESGKLNTESGKLNTESGEVEHRIRSS